MKSGSSSRPVRLAAFALLAAFTGAASAQEAATPPQEKILAVPGAPAPSPAEGPQWRAFSRSASSTFLIDPASVRDEAGVTNVKIARVSLAAPAGDYSHVIEDFAVRCDAGESHLVASTEAFEDGELTETFPVDEPWAAIRPDSFDEAIRQISCGEASPTGGTFASIRAYIDAGRP